MSADTGDLSIGIDIGGTKIAAALVDRSGQALAERMEPTLAVEGPQAVLERVAHQIEDLARAAGQRSILAAGIAVAGWVDSERGVVLNATNLRWVDVPAVEWMERRLGRRFPVNLVRDSNAGALGELVFGAAQGCGDFLYLSLGTGLGAAIVSGGRLVLGANHNAAEVGHIPLHNNPLVCACGRTGCAETITSGPGLLRLIGLLCPDLVPLPETYATPRAVVAAASHGDPFALRLFAELGRRLGEVSAPVAMAINPARVVLGGGLGLSAYDWIAPALHQELMDRLIPGCRQGLEVLKAAFASSAVGAAALAWYAHTSQPEHR